MFAEDSVAKTQGLFTVEAVFARSVAQPGIDHDIIADGDSSRVAAHGIDRSARVGSQRPRRHDGDARQATDREQVEVVECGSLNAYSHVVGVAKLRHGQI